MSVAIIFTIVLIFAAFLLVMGFAAVQERKYVKAVLAFCAGLTYIFIVATGNIMAAVMIINCVGWALVGAALFSFVAFLVNLYGVIKAAISMHNAKRTTLKLSY